MARKNSRNAQGFGSIRQRSDGRWEGRYTIGKDNGNGKQIQKSVYGKSQNEVRKKLHKITVSIDNGEYTEPSKLTVSKWLDIWLDEYIQNTVKSSTYSSYKSICTIHLKPNIGAVKLSKLNPHTIQILYNNLNHADKNNIALSAKTIKNIHGVLHKALKQAMLIGYIKTNPAEVCRLGKIIKKEIVPLQDKDIIQFLKQIKGHPFEALYTVTLFTGMRLGEVLGLKWDCVDFNKGTILIEKQLQRDRTKKEYVLSSNKNGKTRLILPAPSVLKVLDNHRRTQLRHKLKAGNLWIESGFVFTNELGSHLNECTVYRNFKRIVRTMNLPDVRFHDLRHSYAVAALQAGDNIKTVQENLGHHTAAFTLDVYGHVSERMRKESSSNMENFINEIVIL